VDAVLAWVRGLWRVALLIVATAAALLVVLLLTAPNADPTKVVAGFGLSLWRWLSSEVSRL